MKKENIKPEILKY